MWPLENLKLILLVFNAYGSVNAMSYTYDFWKNIIPSTEGLAYRETYYSNTILDEFGEKTNLVLDTLTDFSVYEGNIYLLDSRKTHNKQMSFADLAPGATTAVASVSSLIILNQNFQFIKELDEFEMTDAVKEKLEKYYGFTTPLNEITSAQYTAQEVPNKAPYSASSTDPNKAVLRLAEAQGVEVTSEGIFIADTENSRILKLNSEYVCVDVYLTPADSAFTQYNKEGPLTLVTMKPSGGVDASLEGLGATRFSPICWEPETLASLLIPLTDWSLPPAVYQNFIH